MTKEDAKKRTAELHAEIDKLYKIFNPFQLLLLVVILLNIFLSSPNKIVGIDLQQAIDVLTLISVLGLVWSSRKIGKLRKEQDVILSNFGIW